MGSKAHNPKKLPPNLSLTWHPAAGSAPPSPFAPLRLHPSSSPTCAPLATLTSRTARSRRSSFCMRRMRRARRKLACGGARGVWGGTGWYGVQGARQPTTHPHICTGGSQQHAHIFTLATANDSTHPHPHSQAPTPHAPPISPRPAPHPTLPALRGRQGPGRPAPPAQGPACSMCPSSTCAIPAPRSWPPPRSKRCPRTRSWPGGVQGRWGRGRGEGER